MSDATEVQDGSAALTQLGSVLAEAGAASLNGRREQMAEGLLRAALTKWEDPAVQPQLLGALRAAASGEEGAARMREFMSSQLFRQLGDSLDTAPMDIDQVAKVLGVPPVNINAAQAQVWGVGILRYVLRMEPIASASVDEVVELVAPTIQRYLVG
ncbi:hypothetical protein [Streptomyces sp. NPDC096012]|uniref:TetR/AcrR family transcriptional regulator n=1 Tax=Streptomyces sp. NPDC096012 TaxID=3155684 RepID=UPI00336ADDC5